MGAQPQLTPELTPGITGIRRYSGFKIVFQLPPVDGIPFVAPPVVRQRCDITRSREWHRRHAVMKKHYERVRMQRTHIEVPMLAIVEALIESTKSPDAISAFARLVKQNQPTVKAQISGKSPISAPVANHFGYTTTRKLRTTPGGSFDLIYWKPINADALKQADEAHCNEPGSVAAKAVRDAARNVPDQAGRDEMEAATSCDQENAGAIDA